MRIDDNVFHINWPVFHHQAIKKKAANLGEKAVMIAVVDYFFTTRFVCAELNVCFFLRRGKLSQTWSRKITFRWQEISATHLDEN
ncbi:hypothetical protein ACNKHM_10025 [Shigella sonnei]